MASKYVWILAYQPRLHIPVVGFYISKIFEVHSQFVVLGPSHLRGLSELQASPSFQSLICQIAKLRLTVILSHSGP